MKTSPILLRIIILTILIVSVNQAFSQSKLELSGGFGMPELFNTRIKYGQNFQIGVCAGFYAGKWYGDKFMDWSCAAEISFHFLGKSEYVEQAPWYLLGGLGYYHLPIVNNYEQYNIGFYPRIGRTFNFTKKAGINLDFGVFLPLSMRPVFDSFNFKVLLSGSINLFFRI